MKLRWVGRRPEAASAACASRTRRAWSRHAAGAEIALLSGRSAYNTDMPTYEVAVEVRFAARHSVRLPDGNMEDPHEHDWRATAVFRAGQLDENGFVVDFAAVGDALRQTAAELSGADLNQVVPDDGSGASAERVAEHVARSLKCKLGRDVYCVRLTEAPGCTAAFYPDAAA